jgi:hypothetical protein
LVVALGKTGSGTSSVPQAETSYVHKAVAGLIEAGLAFLESIAASTRNRQSTHADDTHQSWSELFSRDPKTNRPILSIPLPASVTEERLTDAVAGFLRALRG